MSEKTDMRYTVTLCNAMDFDKQKSCKHYKDGGDGYGCEHVIYDFSIDIPFIKIQVCKYEDAK
jgi:hypothetical protein